MPRPVRRSDALVPGERGVLLCVALDQRVAKIILNYAEASFERSPILRRLVASRTADALELTNGVTLEVRPASFRKLRGPTYVAVIADELAFWLALTDEQPSMDDTAAIGGAADIGGPAAGGQDSRICRVGPGNFTPSLSQNRT